jgi:hypothetical protein
VALLKGRRFTGLEREAGYVDLAAKWVKGQLAAARAAGTGAEP